jgi:anaerobic nitric oxide reductase transcription regulator
MTRSIVKMTTELWLSTLVALVGDLPQEIPERERYRRLLQAARALFSCDAVALLKLDGEVLLPLATEGLSSDTLGRRFKVADHPRFQWLLASGQAKRFDADSALPDPYDGLIEGDQTHHEVHDGMGCVLQVEGRIWGLLTLASLERGQFSDSHLALLQSFANLASATVGAVMRINRLATLLQTERTRAESYKRAAGQPERELIGQSAAFKLLLKEIALVGPSELTVLITGETGVGKELVAQALHARSGRADRPLISLNCAALPDTLVESELFGHVRGAFTGAVSERQGKFELADGGTLFLDEIGELPLAAQAKLLRVLQSGQLQRLGSDREHRADVRLIVATNRDLAAEVRAGRLRADIYHRLSVYPLAVPALRERGRDILLLSGFFLEENRVRLHLGGLRLDPDAQAALLAYDWPGNVRELEHLIGRSVLRSLGRHPTRPRILTLTAEDMGLQEVGAPSPSVPSPSAHAVIPGAASSTPASQLGLRQAVEAFERDLVQTTLVQHAHNWASAARALQMDRANLTRLAKRHGLYDKRAHRPRHSG